MFSNNTHLKFLAIVIGQVLILCLFILSRFLWLYSNPELVLQIYPVDPRDPLRGDYMTFDYGDVSSIGVDDLRGATLKQLRSNNDVYVILKKTGATQKYGEVWTYDSLTHTKPSSGVVFIKGVVTSLPVDNDLWRTRYPITLSFGIEDYFIPEGRGREIVISNETSSYAVVVMNADGVGALKKIYVNDEPL